MLRRCLPALRVDITNWEDKLKECGSDEEAAMLLRTRLKTGRVVESKEVRLGRGKVVRKVLERVQDVGVSVLSVALMAAREGADIGLHYYVMDVMKAKNVVPDKHLQTSILHNLSRFARNPQEINEHITTMPVLTDIDYELLIRAYSRVSHPNLALSAFQQYKHQHVPTRTSLYDAVIPCLATYKECKKILKDMEAHGLIPTNLTLARILGVCKKTVDTKNGWVVYNAARMHGLDDVVVKTAMMHLCLAVSNYAKFDDIYSSIPPADRTNHHHLNYLFRCSHANDVQRAEAFFFPLARDRTPFVRLWKQMLLIYIQANDPQKVTDLCLAYRHLDLPHSGPIQLLYQRYTGKSYYSLPTDQPPPFLTEPPSYEDLFPRSWWPEFVNAA
eukprot:TRINITY_DN14243_c0_g1_i1.p1 TRINITY_DN14243_c0_g1~~TRINITY_DN14243_c0_g1_i1.p1  ORF type:complete len:387 (+),score=86.31 TRINITY_DN14243_c0_g1_i1:97-1257(+)